jgi:hypothetical protein
MLTNTGTKWNVIGDPVRADAYYGYTDGVMTCQVIYANFVGGFGIQATLALQPQPEDWFWIKLNPGPNANSDACTPFVQYPLIPLAPTGQNGGDTGSNAFTFVGNFVFLRAVVTREYVQPEIPPYQSQFQNWQWGLVDKVLLSL